MSSPSSALVEHSPEALVPVADACMCSYYYIWSSRAASLSTEAAVWANPPVVQYPTSVKETLTNLVSFVHETSKVSFLHCIMHGCLRGERQFGFLKYSLVATNPRKDQLGTLIPSSF